MKKKLISVIVPIYNSEKYLNKCISSITHQTYKNLEIILIDDGSQDKSAMICEAWKVKDDRIKVFHIQNSGGGAARNLGIDNATGEYIAFVDSDDYISERMFEYLLHQMDDTCDVIECDYIIARDDNSKFDSIIAENENIICNAQEAMHFNIQDRIFRQIIWNKLYKRKVIIGIRFPIGKQIDDEFWTYRVLGNAKKLKHLQIKLYAYRQQPQSVMHKLKASQKMQALEATVEKHMYIKKNFPQLLQESSYHLWMKCIYQGQIVIQEKNVKEIKKEFDYIKKIIRKYPVQNKSILTVKQRLWIDLFKINPKFVCIMRNCLNIGF